MNDEVNELLKDKWFVINSDGVVGVRRTEEGARALSVNLDIRSPYVAPHHAVQLQVKGTLPEGAIMPEFAFGDQVKEHGFNRIRRVTASRIFYKVDNAAWLTRDEISPTDPMRDEFEAWYSPMEKHGGLICGKETAYLIWQAAKGGAK